MEKCVLTSAPYKTKELVVGLRWYANEVSHIVVEKTLFKGSWKAKSRAQYSFSFTVPFGPASYFGPIMNVNWYIFAQAKNLPIFEEAPNVEKEFYLDIPRQYESSKPYVAGYSTIAEFDAGERKNHQYFEIARFIAVVLATLTMLSLTVFGLGYAASVLLLVFIMYFAVIFIRNKWKKIVKDSIGEISVSTEPKQLSPGKTATLILSMTPKKDLLINSIQWELKAIESGSIRRGKSSGYKTSESFSVDYFAPEEDIKLKAGESRSFQLKVDIPNDAPLSFASKPASSFGKTTSLYWTLKLHIDLSKRIDFRDQYPVFFVPGGAE